MVTDVYDIVSTNDNPLVCIMDLVLTPFALGKLATIAKTSEACRGMKEVGAAKLGEKVPSRMKILDKIKGKCRTFV